MKTCVIARSGGTTQATGNLTFTSELEVKDGTTFTANGNTITSKLVVTDHKLYMNINNKKLLFIG